MTSPTSDVLAAASLVVTAVTLLYAAWYEHVQQALGIERPRFRADRDPSIRRLRAVLWSRAVPCGVASVLMSLVFAPDAIRVGWDAVTGSQGRSYDVVKAAYLAVWLLSTGLAVAAASSVLTLARRVRLFEQED
jgi:hypothetical protein